MADREPISLHVKQISREDVFHDIVRLHLDHRPFAKAGRVLVVEAKGRCIRAVARGAPKNDKTGIWLDLEARKKLGLPAKGAEQFTFRKASLLDEVLWAWSATDAMPRIAARLGVVSVGLGAVGVILGVWSVWLTFKS